MYRRYLPWFVKDYHDRVCIKAPQLQTLESKRFSLLNWNVHKNNHHYKWLQDFQHILHLYDPHLISFQEYQTMSERSIIDKQREFGYGFFPNITFKHRSFGLLSAAKYKIEHFDPLLSEGVEPLIKTPKVSFVSQYRLRDGSLLTLINVHMINFVKTQKYIAQINQIEEACSRYEGALILSGDFNTWSHKRMHLLESMVKKSALKAVNFEHSFHKKSFIPHPLDHIFYRGVKAVNSQVLDGIKSSDHKPMLVTFERLE